MVSRALINASCEVAVTISEADTFKFSHISAEKLLVTRRMLPSASAVIFVDLWEHGSAAALRHAVGVRSLRGFEGAQAR
jgi:hypothetical protein